MLQNESLTPPSSNKSSKPVQCAEVYLVSAYATRFRSQHSSVTRGLIDRGDKPGCSKYKRERERESVTLRLSRSRLVSQCLRATTTAKDFIGLDDRERERGLTSKGTRDARDECLIFFIALLARDYCSQLQFGASDILYASIICLRYIYIGICIQSSDFSTFMTCS